MSKILAVGAFLILYVSEERTFADVFQRVPLSELTISGGKVPSRVTTEWKLRNKAEALAPYALLEGKGEIYTSVAGRGESRVLQEFDVYIRLPEPREAKGKLFMPEADLSGMVALDFTVPAGIAKDVSESQFLQVKRDHYATFAQRGIPGAAWFRHQAARGNETNRRGATRNSELQHTFELFNGGRAIIENLQLDRDLRAVSSGESTVDVASLGGITIREMDWAPLIKGVQPKKDFLAAYVPADQHAVFFPTFTAMTTLMDEADRQGTPLLQWIEPRSEDACTRERYQKQLCLELNQVSRVLGPQVISSIAMTGSDPYLRTGSDVGILFEVKSPALLKSYVSAQHAEAKKTIASAETISGNIEGVAYTGLVTRDRTICSYVAEAGNVVYVCNSIEQLRNLIEVAKGKRAALASAPEYTFFRHRYAAGQADESAFIVLTDATIRRWCGPRWRIGNSRRIRVAAALSELQAAHLDELIKGRGDSKINDVLPEAGEIYIGGSTITSSKYGSLEFLTPIAELRLDKVTKQEADAYKSWCDSYQRNWQQFFDPIALRFAMDGRKMKAEVTVMPLIASSDYNNFIRLTSGAAIAPGANDPHKDALVHVALAINTESEMFKNAGNFVGNMNPTFKANPLGWLGQSISIYADADPFWKKLENNDKAEEFMTHNWHQLPVALQCQVKNSLAVAAFLTTLRAFVDQSAPQMTRWQNLEYNGQAYVRVDGRQMAADSGLAQASIYYAVTPNSLVLTLNEPLLKRTIDRAKGGGNKAAADIPPWLGTNLCLQLNHDFLSVIGSVFDERYEDAQQLLSWNNLPILNEWKRLYPAEDPVKLHEKYWHTRLVCPGGGAYVWNEKWDTMESTIYGHPGKPREFPGKALPLAGYRFANFGLSFENQGLSAKVQVETAPGAGTVTSAPRPR